MAIDFTALLAFYPSYATSGMVTRLVYGESLHSVDTTIGTVVKQACRQYALDRRALANAAHFVSGKRNLVPLPLCVGRTFVPLKVHAPLIDGDSAYGYFLLQAIAKVEAGEGGSMLYLAGGVTLPILQRRSTAMNHLARAALFEKVFWGKRLGAAMGESLLWTPSI